MPRILPQNVSVRLDAGKWEIPPIFCWLAKNGNVNSEEMLRTFNCGIGFILIVNPKDSSGILESLKQSGENAWKIGNVENCNEHENQVKIEGFEKAMESLLDQMVYNTMLSAKRARFYTEEDARLRVGVLISGSGTNLQALIDQSMKTDSRAEIGIVISNVAGVKGLERAEIAGIKNKVCRKV